MSSRDESPLQPPPQLFDTWLRVHFSQTPPDWADFHYQWLRAQCPLDRHAQTGERTVDLSDIAAEVRPLAAAVIADGEEASLRIEWSGAERRQSRYAFAWLREHAYARNREVPPPPPSDLRAITLHAGDHPDDESLVVAALARVAERGAVVVRGYRRPGRSEVAEPADPDDTEALIRAFGLARLAIIGTHFGRIEDLRTDNTTNQNTDQLGYTDAAIEVHTDQPFLDAPPRYQLLHCMRAAAEGGDNHLVDARAAARYLEATDAEAFRLLTTVPVRFHRKQRAFERLVISPILRLDAEGRFQVRYSYFTMAPQQLPFAEMAAWLRAYRRFAELVRDPAHRYTLRLGPGDFILYDNHRTLHARTGFRGARWVRGVYFN